MPPSDAVFDRRLSLFPVTTSLVERAGKPVLAVSGLCLADLAEQYGTPLYMVDRPTLEHALGEYRQALSAHYPAPSGITYAGKAFLCLGMAQWVAHQQLCLDCTGTGELEIGAAGGIARGNLLVHGVNKSPEDLQAAVRLAGTLVVDNPSELGRLVEMHARRAVLPELWLRLRPGVAVQTHRYTQTGQEDSKFGFGVEELLEAVQTCQAQHLPLSGLHFHLGSHFHSLPSLADGLELTLDALQLLHLQTGWLPEVVCPGGGWGVPYHEDDLPYPGIDAYIHQVAQTLLLGCQRRGLPLPRLQVEPGRSLVARAGVAIYRVGAVKTTLNRRWLLLDGGMADNIRPALYGASYTALPVNDPQRKLERQVWLGGPYCESGDVLISGLDLPDIQAGECVAIPVSGAYQLSMSSNYNGSRRPCVLWLDNGQAQILQKRETVTDLLRRDQSIAL